MVSLPHENLAAAGEALIGHELAAPSFTHRIRLPAPLLLRLLKPHEAAVHLAKTAPDLLARPEVAQAMEQAFCTRWCPASVAQRPPRLAMPVTATLW
jgi:hypothetical protein